MKTQQRKFVVERKVGRRRLTMQSASIWGDTDLKALAREAQTDAPHLFAQDTASNSRGQVSEPQAEAALKTHLSNEIGNGEQKLIFASAIEVEQNSPSQQGDDVTLNAAAQLKLDTTGPRSPTMARRRRVATGSGHAEGASIAPTVQPTATKNEASADELIALDEENQRLKGLLAQHFQLQNIQLRTMLARFGVN